MPGIGLSRSRAPLTRNFTCSTYGVITSINQRLHTVQTAGGSASSLPGHRPHAQNYREGGEHDFDHGCSSRVHRDDEQLRRHQRRVVPIALLPGSRLWREGRGGLRRGGGKLQVSVLLSSRRAQGGAHGEVRHRIGTYKYQSRPRRQSVSRSRSASIVSA